MVERVNSNTITFLTTKVVRTFVNATMSPFPANYEKQANK
jgi:hypothetical protein